MTEKPDNSSEGKKQRDWVDYTTALGMPLVVALLGIYFTYSTQNEGLKQKYVELAINILSNDKTANTPIRQWAFQLLDRYAPIKFAAVDPALPQDILKGLGHLDLNSVAFQRLNNQQVQAAGHGYAVVGDIESGRLFDIPAKKTGIFRCEASNLRIFDGIEKSYARSYFDGILEVHIFDKSNEKVPANKITFNVNNGSGGVIFRLEGGQTAKFFNTLDAQIGRGELAIGVIGEGPEGWLDRE